MNNRTSYRPKKSIATFVVGSIFLIGIATESIMSRGFNASVTTLVVISALAIALYLVLYRPHLEIFDEGVRIHNPLTMIQVGWHDVDSIDARYSAVLTMKDGRRFTIWCAQAPGRYHARTIHPSEMKGLNLPSTMRPGESPRTDSGVAVILCRQRLTAFQHSTHVDGAAFLSQRENGWIAILAIVYIAALVLILH